MAVAAPCAGGACCHQFRITLKWDHQPRTHLDTHAKQDHTRILRPEGFSSCVFPLPVSHLTVLLNRDTQNWKDRFRWGNTAFTWYFNCSFWHQVPREGPHWKPISFISCFPCMQICLRCAHIAYTCSSFLADGWEKTGNGRLENDRVMSQRKLTIFPSAPNSWCLHSEKTEKRRRLRQL